MAKENVLDLVQYVFAQVVTEIVQLMAGQPYVSVTYNERRIEAISS